MSFRATGRIANQPKAVSTLSNDKKAVTHLLEETFVEVTAKDDVRSDQEAITIQGPLKPSDDSTTVKQFIRGFVDVDKGIEATLIVIAHGRTKTVNLQRLKNHENFQIELTSKVPKNSDFAATYILNLHSNKVPERVRGFVVLDSIDLLVTKSTKKSKKKKVKKKTTKKVKKKTGKKKS